MRITNTGYSPIEVVAEIGVSVGITAADTKQFFGNRSHPQLVELLRDKLDVILASFKRYGSQAAETQYIRDHGVDVRLDFELPDASHRRIGFQIKSNSEADADKLRRTTKRQKEETLVGTLKRQAFEAENTAGVHEWWIVCCFDAAAHRDLISAINSEVGSGIGRPKIRIVEPREAYALLSKDDVDLDALCTLLLCEDDEVLVRARKDCSRLGKKARSVVLQTIGRALEGERELTLDDLLEMFEGDLEKAANAVDILEGSGYVRQQSGGQIFLINPAEYPGLCALYFEGRVRHDHDPEEAADFVERMMNAL
jgi:hypothetical protein